MARERGKNLLAVDDPAALDGLRFRAERGAAGCSRAAFRKRLRVDRAILDNALVMDRAAALVLGAHGLVHVEVVSERAGPQGRANMHVPGQRRRAAIAADLVRSKRIGLIIGAKPPMLLRNRYAEQSAAMQVRVILG